ncbi:UDP-N-acetylmuramoyl-L-alanine--D-glutamate ligase [Alkalibacillus salilacus]|uniref:UDP-N-acetylmuramoylalanine--D-glutamate ligase n=1 Tax=Alkalibacillus salilacus TaxID=284582 RepID=A0ABT9VE22_9BACI|nr:UDP-N-acetylmuramoyl-L-alanine--D-glutamate ligase [Alkalibacillus salilacus]MDQ0159181.1 UDP-N-acetylmuramoylalanine--D-glutamate ligase [Alkalibacillus salilacus]
MKTLKNFPYQHVLVLGLAKSGQAAAQLLYDSHISFAINDKQPFEHNETAQYFAELGVEVVTGDHPLSVLDGVDLVVKNPGIPHQHVIVAEAEKQGVPVVTEVELAYLLIDGPLVAITGTNGKTTTTTLVHRILDEAGLNPLLAGNIGVVASEVVREQKPSQPVVMELSSFQLKAIHQFKPDIAVLLNITEAHLDYHQTLEDYVNSKFRLVERQTADDFVVYNHDDSTIASKQEWLQATPVPFSVTHSMDYGVTCFDGDIYIGQERLMAERDVALPGDHNLENVLASIAVASQFNVPHSVIESVLKQFTGVKHRLQFVKSVDGRLVYNDSKATNILATTKAIQSFSNPIVLIAGGLDRGVAFDELIAQFDGVKYCVVYGESAQKIAHSAYEHDYHNVTICDNIDDATNEAYLQSEVGDVILLSPACASWDQFKTFEDRGDMFIDVVHKL